MVTTYLLTAVLNSPDASSISVRTQREMRILSESIDALVQGKVDCASDILMQRFKALEVACRDKSWTITEKLELIPESRVTAATIKEHEVARKEASRALRLEKELDPKKTRSR